ncbi:hypothetical protein GTW51_08955 [Aurantimonas aggregata]|uniref:DUF5872 domain-containing protein n=1 Tax=Aurantimonas aggregata TaxID=2047720 RepID=A0A6L9MH40_9HYPH|nr:hypothetical protein [Aurantimonas aggregata]NDV86830.1 hypothetical protein [Aurantimonas aggregata]
MTETAEKSDPKLWEKVKAKVTKGSKGGKPGQWSARKAQLATHEYQAAGGGYVGEKADDNSLQQWTDEDWGTKSGAESGKSGERYLPKKARAHLSDAEYQRTSDKKQRDTKKGRQFSAQPKDIAKKTARDRGGAASKADLYGEAKRRDIAGRSKMSKAELEKALRA